MEKETFILRTEWYEAVQELDNQSKAELLDNLFLFHLNEETKINLNNLSVKLVWKLIEPNLKRNIDAYDKRKSTSSENGKKGGRPPKNQQVEEKIENLNNLNKPNESLSVSVLVPDSDNVSFLKETKQNACENSEILEPEALSFLLELEKEEKEKSSAKKEKENQELRDSEFFKSVCDFFSQTLDHQKMKTFGDIVRIRGQNLFDDFEKQTNAYIEFKNLSGQEIHSWQNYISQWTTVNWIDKLQKWKLKSKPINEKSKGKFSGNSDNKLKSAI